MFRRLFVANRGEVAARVLRTCRRLGIRTRLAVSDVDAALSYTRMADEVALIGGPKAYLDQDALLRAAEGCSALHPGWGFLSENATFAARCEAQRITFVGPRPTAMRSMGDKAEARRTIRALGIDPIPGTDVLADAAEARLEADRMGYPVLLKALAGGGGRGMRRVDRGEDIVGAFEAASTEARSAFGNGAMYMEKLVLRGRHIEFQVLGDGRHAVHLRERECSVQRRHQKLLEETPSPVVARDEADELGARLARACEVIGYRGAGTVEMFRSAEGRIYFMEMNTRLQVEHPITEAITGLDLVEEQLRIAANEPLLGRPLAQRPRFDGHAIECRINAEDPSQSFRPTPGRVARLVLPQGEGIRIDTHLAEGDTISPHYDSMFCKLVAHGPTRLEAIARMDRALAELVVEGVATTAAFHRRVLAHPDFVAGTYDTTLVERMQA